MKPEQSQLSPEKPKQEYELIADELMATIEDVPEDDDAALHRKAIIDKFLLDVIDRAENGEITGSRGNIYDKGAIMGQFVLYDQRLREQVDRPQDAIPGFNGLRTAFTKLASSDLTGRYFADSIDDITRSNNQYDRHPAMTGEVMERQPISPESAEKIGGAVLGAIEVQEPQPETDLEMNERFLRETQQELQELYAEHRQLDPRSYKAQAIENQIKYAKEDAGSFAKKVAQLKGRNWT